MAEYHRPDQKMVQNLKDLANKLRIHSIQSTSASNSGHPTSCCSVAEIFSVLFFHTMKYKVKEPRHRSNDRFVLSKGHACPILYAAWAEAGLFPVSDLMNLRKIDSDLEGHPTPRLNFIDVATGSLGQGLSCAAGMAYVGKYIDKASYRVFCVVGDGESMEGSIWEALHFASMYKLDNLVAVFDVNRLGQSQATSLEHDLETYRKRLEAFGFNTYIIDGHDVEALCKTFYDANTVTGRPTAIIAKTLKGKGIPGIENELNWHGKPLGSKSDEAVNAIKAEITNPEPHRLIPPAPVDDAPIVDISNIKLSEPPAYKKGEMVATRLAYGTALVKIGRSNDRVIALDGDVKNSTFSIKFMDEFPERYIECFIAEQNMAGVAIGCGTRSRTVPFASSFAAFWSRAYDQLRMGAVSMCNLKVVGSHAGISIGPDGPSQMALEDLAMFRAIPGCVVFYPTDAVSTERAVELAAQTQGMCFIRTGRPNAAILYDNDEKFQIGKAKELMNRVIQDMPDEPLLFIIKMLYKKVGKPIPEVIRKSNKDQVTLVGAGVTITEGTIAADILKEQGVNVRIVDPFTIKPIDSATLLECARATGGRVITVEDHYPEGGLGEAVAGALSNYPNVTIRRLAVTELPRSGKPDELMDMFGISSKCIIKAIKEMVS